MSAPDLHCSRGEQLAGPREKATCQGAQWPKSQTSWGLGFGPCRSMNNPTKSLGTGPGAGQGSWRETCREAAGSDPPACPPWMRVETSLPPTELGPMEKGSGLSLSRLGGCSRCPQGAALGNHLQALLMQLPGSVFLGLLLRLPGGREGQRGWLLSGCKRQRGGSGPPGNAPV